MNFLFLLLLSACFGTIWVITYFQSQSLEHAYEDNLENLPGADEKFSQVKTISILVSGLIVCFNKFCLGKMIHVLTEYFFFV